MSVQTILLASEAAQPGNPIVPSAVRYIKLGTGNAWFESCRKNNRVEFGHDNLPHEVALSGSREAIVQYYLKLGYAQGKASDLGREVFEFYTLDEDCLWITFAEGSLWWAFARTGVSAIERGAGHGERYRLLVTPWSNRDAKGDLLSISSLSSRLTKVAAYRQTLCSVAASDYLLRRINGADEPLVAEAREVQNKLVSIAERLIAGLHWRDFEVLCDLIFARSGWQRVAELGGLQKDTDLVLEQTATRERAFVQVKSEATQQTLNEYAAVFEANAGFHRMFFACHSPRGKLSITGQKPIHIWTGETTARQAIAAGLLDWLVDKTS